MAFRREGCRGFTNILESNAIRKEGGKSLYRRLEGGFCLRLQRGWRFWLGRWRLFRLRVVTKSDTKVAASILNILCDSHRVVAGVIHERLFCRGQGAIRALDGICIGQLLRQGRQCRLRHLARLANSRQNIGVDQR